MTNQDTDRHLDDLFATAAAQPPAPSDAFLEQMRRVAVDSTPVVATPLANPTRPGWSWAGFWQTGAVCAVGAVVGLSIGLSPPDGVLTVTSDLFATQDLWDLSGYSAFDTAEMEGI